jgi:riboflavin kinase, archaea type
MKITGVIESGLGKGAFFTSLEWVVDQFERAMGFKPFPGTLNVRVLEGDLPALRSFFAKKDFELVPDNPAFCTALLKKVRVNGTPAAAVFPSEDVKAHGREIIELISEKHLKDTHGLKDGDQVTITEFEFLIDRG